MKLNYISFCCILTLTNTVYVKAMEATRPLARSHSAEDLSASSPFVAPNISALRAIAANRPVNRTATNNILAHQQTAPLIVVQPAVPAAEVRANPLIEHIQQVSPSAPPLSELPSYEESAMQRGVATSAQTALMQALALAHAEMGTQTDAYEEARPSLPLCNSQAIPSSSTASLHSLSPFDETDEEYKKLLTNAREKRLEENFLALLNAAHSGDHKIAEELLNSPQCTEVGTLPLRAAIQGGSLETVQTIIPFFTLEDVKAILIKPIHHGQIDIFTFISNYWEFKYDGLSFLEKALAYGTIDETFLDHMVSRGLNVNEIIISGGDYGDNYRTEESNSRIAEENVKKMSPLYAAVRLNNSNAVRYFLKKNPSPFTIKLSVNRLEYTMIENPYTDLHNFYDLFLAEAKTPSIKKMLMDRERLDREELNKTRLELKRLKQEALERERLKERKEYKKKKDSCTIQ